MAKEVVVYSSNTCNYCAVLKKYLTDNNIEFISKNISEDKEAKKELMSMGFMSVPLTVIGEEKLVGFDEKKLAELLEIKK